ncbi:MAG: hypothetical protein K2Y22_06340 [Candidatus Obscuribacterales bacterium]|nr:hypothetical protein [Candidatus Obscuribacterales bacterium]
MNIKEILTDVIRIVQSSTGKDWLYFLTQEQLTYRRDLLIRIERGDAGKFQLCYGALSVGEVDVVIDDQKMTTGHTIRVELAGLVKTVLSDVSVVTDSSVSV